MTLERRGPLRRFGRALLRFLGTTVRMWIVLIALGVGLVLIWAVSSNVKSIDRHQREADNRGALAAAYAADLRAYDNAVRAHDDCLADVARSELNRGQHEALVQAFESLLSSTPPPYRAPLEQIVADLRAGPLLSRPPRSPDECPPVPTPPAAPGGG